MNLVVTFHEVDDPLSLQVAQTYLLLLAMTAAATQVDNAVGGGRFQAPQFNDTPVTFSLRQTSARTITVFDVIHSCVF